MVNMAKFLKSRAFPTCKCREETTEIRETKERKVRAKEAERKKRNLLREERKAKYKSKSQTIRNNVNSPEQNICTSLS